MCVAIKGTHRIAMSILDNTAFYAAA